MSSKIKGGYGRRDCGACPHQSSAHPASFTFHVLRFTFHHSPSTPHHSRSTPAAFTLIELILVMAILTMAVSVTAPAMSRFFRGRTLDSEARRLLALTRVGQSRAVAEGIPVDLWVDVERRQIGLEVEPSYESQDAKRESCDVDASLQIEVLSQAAAAPAPARFMHAPSIASLPKIALAKPSLPTIRFLPDGTIAASSPQMLRLTDRDGFSLLVAQTTQRNCYEIRSSQN